MVILPMGLWPMGFRPMGIRPTELLQTEIWPMDFTKLAIADRREPKTGYCMHIMQSATSRVTCLIIERKLSKLNNII
jgi:hypothetical protein